MVVDVVEVAVDVSVVSEAMLLVFVSVVEVTEFPRRDRAWINVIKDRENGTQNELVLETKVIKVNSPLQ